MKKYVVTGSNRYQDFDFLTVVWGLVWRTITDYEPVVLLTENRESWNNPIGRVVLDGLDYFGIRKHYVGPIKEAYRTSFQAQACRQHAAILKSFDPEEYIMLADVDMLATSGEWFNKVDWSKSIHLRYSNAWHYYWFTTPYIGCKVKVWREFMQYEAGGEIAPVLEKALDKHITPEGDSWQAHFFDEHYYNSKLKASRFYPDDCDFIERDGHPPKDRIDRCRWPANFDNVSKFSDAHVIRPSWRDDNWGAFRPLIEKLIPKHMQEIDTYRAKYAEARK